jgi:AcrR family transcriptional regulator
MSSEARRPGLTRRAIAKAALELVDAEGAERLTVRNLAGRLDAGAMSLYRHVPSREAIVADVVGLLLDEIEMPAEEIAWEEGARRVGRSLRAMALRHPHAFALVASAPSHRPPLVGFAARLRAFYVARGVPAEAFEGVWSILDAFETGFLLLETQALLAGWSDGGPADSGGDLDAETRELPSRMPRTLGEDAYEEGMDIIIAGLSRRFASTEG